MKVLKEMKRAAVVLLAAAAAVLPLTPAFAVSVYRAPDTSGVTTEVEHSLRITQSPYNLAGGIHYRFAVDTGAGPTVASPEGASAADLVTGNPAFVEDTVSYGPGDDFSGGDHTVTKAVQVSWEDVVFQEPGIYYWKVNKSQTPAVEAPLDPAKTTNEDAVTYLWAYVTDDGSTQLVLSATGLSTSTALSEKALIEDAYPAEKVDLAVSKSVTGAQASKDQYFRFDITLTLPANVATDTYAISGFDDAATVNASPYNSGATQPEGEVTLFEGKNQKISVWLKHGQAVRIAGLPYGTGYTVTESANGGYEVTTAAVGDQKNGPGGGTDLSVGTGAAVTDTSLEQDTTVQYTNTREGTTPTGILLQYGAPAAGAVLAVALLGARLFGRRRRTARAEETV